MKKLIYPILLLLLSNFSFAQGAYYPFSGNANDATVNANNGIVNGATLVADRFGNPNSAYHFNGVNNSIQIPNSASLQLGTQMSLCAWVRPTGFYLGACHGNSIIMKGDADFLPGNYLLRFDDGAFTNYTNCAIPGVDPLHQNFYGGSGAASAFPGYTPYIQVNQWHSVVATYDGTTARLYVNCQLVASNPQSAGNFTNTFDLFLGRLNNGAYPYWLNGDLDEVKIYDRAITPAEVNAYGGCTGNPVPCDGPNTSTTVQKCIGVDIILNARNGSGYLWNPGTFLNSTIIQNPTCSANTNITYTVRVLSPDSTCFNMDTIHVVVNDCGCEDSCNWSLTGNTTVLPQNFIGSKNNADFKIRTNNTQRMVVSAAGNVGINTITPAKLLDVNGEARVGTLPASAVNDRIVFANASGDLKSLAASGNTNQYLSGNGTWQNITGGGTINAGQGLTIDQNAVHLGDRCGGGSGLFTEGREVNMNNFNLYFNSSDEGKIYMGPTGVADLCRPLESRLEISTQGLPGAANDYNSPTPSTSGLRFTDLTANTTPMKENRFKGVLSLDEDGDVIWVTACCDKGGLEDPQLKTILERLTKLENEVKASKTESALLKSQLAQMDVVLSKTNTVVLNQNVPNPFSESTVITYSIPKIFGKAQIIFSTITGEVIKTVDIKSAGKGQVNVFANDISSGIYTYTLVIDGNHVETKKMIKQ